MLKWSHEIFKIKPANSEHLKFELPCRQITDNKKLLGLFMKKRKEEIISSKFHSLKETKHATLDFSRILAAGREETSLHNLMRKREI